VTEVEDDGHWVVLLRVRQEEIQQEAFAAAGGTEHKRMANILNVQREMKRCLVARLEDCERVVIQMTTPPVAAVEREEEAQISVVRL
jgi:hypothetical protein